MGEKIPLSIIEESSIKKQFYKFRQEQIKVLRSGDYQSILDNATIAAQNTFKFSEFLNDQNKMGKNIILYECIQKVTKLHEIVSFWTT